MGRKRFTTEQIIHKLRAAEVELDARISRDLSTSQVDRASNTKATTRNRCWTWSSLVGDPSPPFATCIMWPLALRPRQGDS